jgi:hypothetical protein
MADQTAKTDQTSKDKPFVFPDLNNYVVPSVEILLISGFGVILVNYLLGGQMLAGNNRTAASQNTLATKAKATTPATTAPVVQSGTVATTQQVVSQNPNPVAVNGTHRALCATSDQGLNFRPAAGFSTPLFAVPCGGIVTVTGNPVNVENETWSPVTYAGRNGWSATKLLQPLR